MRKSALVVWSIITIFSFITGLVLVVSFSLGFDSARALADLFARDGSAGPFTQAFYEGVRIPITLVGIILLVLSLSMLVWKRRSLGVVGCGMTVIQQFWTRFRSDAGAFAADFHAIRLSRSEVLALVVLILIAILARAFFVMQPFKHDEAYTVAVFANQPLRDGLADYHLPNNHLFHTLLVHIVYSVLGYLQWAVRLPSFTAGVLTIPALYLLARTLHGRTVAFIAAASAAALPVLVDFSTQSRGYTLVMLFSLILFTLGIYVRRRPNLFAWGMVVIVVVLGIYTIPIFYFSYISFLFWLGLAFLAGDVDVQAYGSRWKFILWGFISGILTVLFTVLLYTPPALRSGLQAVLPYQVSDPLSYDLFMQEANVRLSEFVSLSLMELPTFAGWLLVIGFVLSLIFPVHSETIKGKMRVRIPLQAAVTVGTFGLIFALRAPPWARFLTFLVPLALMWAAAGWVGFLRWLQYIFRIQWKLDHVLAALVLLGVVVGTLVRFDTHRNAGFNVIGYEEAAVRFLKDELKGQDFVVVTHPRDAAVWYYAYLYQLDRVYFRTDRPVNRVFALVDSVYEQTLEDVIAERGPQERLDLSGAKQVFEVGTLQVFELMIQK